MRHKVTKRKLGREPAPRRALIKNLLTSLILYEKIKTTEAKAKMIKPLAERLVTHAKIDNLHQRRELMKKVTTQNAVKKIFEVLGPRYQTRKGGYLRIIKLGRRRGDSAKMAQIEFV